MKTLSKHLSESIINEAILTNVLSTKLKYIEVLSNIIKKEPDFKFLMPKTKLDTLNKLSKDIEKSYNNAKMDIPSLMKNTFHQLYLSNININFDPFLLHEIVKSGMYYSIKYFLNSEAILYDLRVAGSVYIGFKLKDRLSDSQSLRLTELMNSKNYNLELSYDGTGLKNPMIGWDESSWKGKIPTLAEIL